MDSDMVMLVDAMAFLNPKPGILGLVKGGWIDMEHNQKLLCIPHLISKMLHGHTKHQWSMKSLLSNILQCRLTCSKWLTEGLSLAFATRRTTSA